MPRIKFVLEYDFQKVPISLLWQFISTNSGLERWYADEVLNQGKDYTIVWNDEPQEAKTPICVFIGKTMAMNPLFSK